MTQYNSIKIGGFISADPQVRLHCGKPVVYWDLVHGEWIPETGEQIRTNRVRVKAWSTQVLDALAEKDRVGDEIVILGKLRMELNRRVIVADTISEGGEWYGNEVRVTGYINGQVKVNPTRTGFVSTFALQMAEWIGGEPAFTANFPVKYWGDTPLVEGQLLDIQGKITSCKKEGIKIHTKQVSIL